MAYMVTTDGKKLTLSAEQGLFLWKAMHDTTNLDEALRVKVSKIRGLWLNWRTAPDEYIKENLGGIIHMALSDWIVDRAGKPIKPHGDFAWKFAKRWGLWEDGKPPELVTRGVTIPAQTSMAGGFPINH